MTKKEQLIAWLTDAHGLELELVTKLDKSAEGMADVPGATERIKQHADESREQAKKLEAEIKRLGGDVSAVKSGMGKAMGSVASTLTSMFEDQPIKIVLASYGAENFEIACYASLITAAEELGEEQTAQVCEEILEQEQAMADWLESQIEPVTMLALDKATE